MADSMQDALDKLRAGDTIPGFNKDVVVDGYVEAEFKESLDSVPPEEREKRKKRFVEHYITGPGKQFIDTTMAQVTFYYTQAKEGLQSIQESTAQVVASNAVPAVITVGSASSTPNPAYSAIENLQKKKSLLAIIKTVTEYLAQMLTYAILLHFVLPSSVMLLVSTLATVTSLITAIPG